MKRISVVFAILLSAAAVFGGVAATAGAQEYHWVKVVTQHGVGEPKRNSPRHGFTPVFRLQGGKAKLVARITARNSNLAACHFCWLINPVPYDANPLPSARIWRYVRSAHASRTWTFRVPEGSWKALPYYVDNVKYKWTLYEKRPKTETPNSVAVQARRATLNRCR